MSEGTGFRELRCSNPDCGANMSMSSKLLGKSLMMPGSVLEIKCPRCGIVTQFKSVGIGEEEVTH